ETSSCQTPKPSSPCCRNGSTTTMKSTRTPACASSRHESSEQRPPVLNADRRLSGQTGCTPLDVAGAVKEVSRSVARSAMLPLKDAAFAETAYETGIHIGRGLLIPFNDTYRALKEGDVVGALVS